MKNWTIKDYQKDTVSIDLFFFLCRKLGQDREECVVETLAICASNPWTGERSLKTGAGSLKKQELEVQPNPPEFWQMSKLRMNLHDHNWY